MRKQFFYTILFVVFIAARSFGQFQTPSFFGINYSPSKIKNDSINGTSNDVNAYLNFPVYRNDKQFIGARINYESIHTNEVNSYFDRHFTGTDLNVFWQSKLNEKHKLYVFAKGGIYSDYKDISGKDIRFLIGSGYITKNSDRLSTGFGLIYGRQFFGNQINPYIAIDYDITPKLNLSGILPVRPVLTYKISNRFSWVNEIDGNVQTFRLSQTDYDNSFVQIIGWKYVSSAQFLAGKHHMFTAGIGYLAQTQGYYNDEDVNNWKIFTFNISQKNKPIELLKMHGVTFSIGYDFVL